MPLRHLQDVIVMHLPSGPVAVAVTAAYSVASEVAPLPLSEATLFSLGPYAVTMPAVSALVAIIVGLVTIARHALEIRKLRRDGRK